MKCWRGLLLTAAIPVLAWTLGALLLRSAVKGLD